MLVWCSSVADMMLAWFRFNFGSSSTHTERVCVQECEEKLKVSVRCSDRVAFV
jgi:hypothetical protein